VTITANTGGLLRISPYLFPQVSPEMVQLIN